MSEQATSAAGSTTTTPAATASSAPAPASSGAPASPAAAPKVVKIDAAKTTAEEAVNRLIIYSVGIGASDLFFMVQEDKVRVQVRHLGMIRTISELPLDLGRRAVSHVKVAANMDVAERRRPADGRWLHRPDSAKGEVGHPVDVRVGTIPTIHGEDMALRLLVRDTHLFALENLGLHRQQLAELTNMVDSPSGLILVSGPTGSGKTATLYACLNRLNDGRRKINTIEDPIEYALDGVRQSQVNPAIDLGFDELLRSVLRQSPDVVMIGEVRDAETAATAVRAANSGHLVLATIHAPAAAAAIQSMRGLGVHPHFLSTALRGIVSQRLARTLCPACKISFDLSISPHTFDEVRHWLGPEDGRMLWAAKGCEKCNGVGYAGRTGVFEVMSITRPLRNLISEGAPAREIRVKALEQKMIEFRQAALLKVALGVTSTEEVFRVIPTEHLLLDD